MQQNSKGPSVSLDLVRILIRYVSAKGLDGMKLWHQTGLGEHLLQSGDARISARRFDTLWRAVENETGDLHFGLQLGQSVQKYASGNLLYAVLMNSPSVGEALGKFCRYHGIMSSAVQPRLIDSGTAPQIILETPYPALTLDIGHEAFIFSLLASVIENLTGNRESIMEVRFSHQPPEKLDSYHRIFACPIKFRHTVSALLLAKSALEKPVFLANPHLLAELEFLAFRHVQQLSMGNSVSCKVANAISQMLINGDKPSVKVVAKDLAMSTRQLQQKLKNEQTGYQKLLDQVREQMAMRLLADRRHTISDITFILGYAEQSSFTHAIQKWTGKTPGQLRNKG
jgi:AraC-like DNA-binding protein